jgi:hypothetical protein
MSRFTSLEAAATASVVACALAAIVPSCIRSIRMSRTAEATENLDRIARAWVAHAGDPGVSLPTPLTPPLVPRGAAASDPPGTWDHPTWRALGFSIPESEPHWYAYRVEARDEGREVVVVAHGDLDGDGVTSTYTRTIRREAAGWVASPVLLVTADLE